MDTKTALKFAASFVRVSRGKTKKELHKMFTLEQIALISLSSAFLKQRLVIKEYQKREEKQRKFLRSL